MKKLFGSFFVLCTAVWGQSLASPDINSFPTRQFGHPSLLIPPTQGAPNYVEGREFDFPGQIAFDAVGNLYVTDIGNNRVLAFKPGSAGPGHKADLVIGQQDFQSTFRQGSPTGSYTTGLSSPTGIAVDANGNVYVADAGNNRILRFPQPFSQTSLPVQPDLVIGQKSFSSGNSANMTGTAACANNTVAFSYNNQPAIAGLAIDGSGNLWVADADNNRVLMFPSVANIPTNTTLPVATVVIGQTSFTTCGQPSNGSQTNLAVLAQPSSVALDSTGNLYIADGYSRVLYFTAPFAPQGQGAQRVLGVVPAPTSGQTIVYPTQYSLGMPSSGGGLIPPSGIFTKGNNLFVADTPANRIVEYDVPSNWPSPLPTSPSPPIINVIGQPAFATGTVNQGLAQASQYTLSNPYAGAFVGSQMWVSDSGNNRVLSYTASAGGYSGASTVVGQLDFEYNAPNLIEGKEVNFSGASGSAAAMVVDNSSSPPHLYVVDTGNNRILGFKNAYTVGSTTPPAVADLVIGQPDVFTSEINYPSGLAAQPTQMGLNAPVGVVVDNNGNLYVADSGNGRVLRFPAPFNQHVATGSALAANLVLGQSSFTTVVKNAQANSMRTPWGLALFSGSDANATPLAGGLAVSDVQYSRVLYFPKASGGDFTNGEAATLVFGQPNFTTVTSGTGPASLSSPAGIASDSSDRLYVADAGNNRIVEFEGAPQSVVNGVTSSQTLPGSTYGFNTPQAVAINYASGELWVADTNNFRLLRFPEYTTCQLISCAVTAQLSTTGGAALGLGLDADGNVIVGDIFNEVTFYFAQAFFRNGASFNTQPLAPGMIAILGRLGKAMSISDGSAQVFPWPSTLGNVNVTVNGTPAPIYATNSTYGAIYFQVPSSAPTSGTATFIVTNATTQEILSVGQFQMAKTNPGFFTSGQQGFGQVAARNVSDNTNNLNGPSHPIARGGTVAICLTGYGQVSGSPPDGSPATTTPSTGTNPIIVVNTNTLTSAQIGYSGLGCGFPGGWQINLTVPAQGTLPNAANPVALLYLDVPSKWGGNPNNAALDGTPGPDVIVSTTIWVGN